MGYWHIFILKKDKDHYVYECFALDTKSAIKSMERTGAYGNKQKIVGYVQMSYIVKVLSTILPFINFVKK